jgi:hypothetical protein
VRCQRADDANAFFPQRSRQRPANHQQIETILNEGYKDLNSALADVSKNADELLQL